MIARRLSALRRWAACLLIATGAFGLGGRVLAQASGPDTLPAEAPAAEAPPADSGFVVICPIDGMVDDGLAVLVERAVEESKGAKAFILVVNTPGGLVDAAIDITSHLGKARCPTIAYIEGMGAISAGAMISYACDKMVMTGEANIGAATPVVFSQEGTTVAGEKSVSFVRAKFRTLAEVNGYNSDIAEAMVDPDVVLVARTNDADELEISAAEPAETNGDDEDAPAGDGTRVVSPKGKLLTLSARQAQDWGLIPYIATDLDDALDYFDLATHVKREVIPTWSEQLFRFLTNPTIAGILLFLGIGGLYLEAQTPGFGFPGIIGLTCLALFFGAHMLIGLADWVDVLLVIVGVGLILVEILVLPGFGVAGVAGIACLGLGLYMSLTRVTIPEYSWEFDRLDDVAISFVVTIIGLIGVAALTGWLFPKTPFYGKLVLLEDQRADKGFVVKTSGDVTIGMRGVATSMLRPSGRARINDQSVQVIARGEFIDPGTPVVVVQTDENRVVVDIAKNGG